MGHFIEPSTKATLSILFPFFVVFLGVVIAVLGKAARKFPFQPDEYKVFHWPILPRMHSKIYVVTKTTRKERTAIPNRHHENPHS
jgi:hypothetical protein